MSTDVGNSHYRAAALSAGVTVARGDGERRVCRTSPR
jgi:hypothetical protein